MFKYRLKRLARPKVIFWTTFILLFFVSMGSIVRFYAADVTVFEGGVSSNITEDTVIVNDLQADWDYYESLNFTEITDKEYLPTGTNSLKYTKDTLVAVQINYDGRDVNDSNLLGRISTSRSQSNYVYYKYYPIKNGEIKIELIDNPYSWRPMDGSVHKGFNGWVCDDEKTEGISCSDMEFSYDYDYYLRYVTIPASKVETDNDGNLKMVLNLRATWVDATYVSYNNYNFNNNNTVNSALKEKKMTSLKTEQMVDVVRNYIGKYRFIEGQEYYEKRTADVGSSFNGYWINENGIVEDYFDVGKLCENGLYGNEITPATDETEEIQKCVYYVLTSDNASNETTEVTKEYWFKKTNSDSSISFEKVDFLNGTGLFEIFYLENKLNGQYKLSDYENGDSLVGLYYKTTLGSDTSLYYNESGQRCDMNEVECDANAVYKLIQSGDSLKVNGESISTMNIHTTSYTQEEDWNNDTVVKVNNGITSNESKYYYLVTRDTNIIHITGTYTQGSNVNGYNDNHQDIPYTLSGSPYGSTINARLDIASSGLYLDDDMVIENFKSGSYLAASGSTDYRGGTSSIFAEYNNLKITGIVENSGYFFAGGVVGGSNSAPYNRYSKTIIESGYYYYCKTLGGGDVAGWTSVIMQYGSDYDRVSNNNDTLKVYRTISTSFGGDHDSADILPSSFAIVKSGMFGSVALGNNSFDESEHFSYGIYAGSYGGGSGDSLRILKIEGGNIACVNGGPGTDDVRENVVAIYMTGGRAINVVGGAGTDEGEGHRVVSISGGTVINAVAGGSNSNVGGGIGLLHGKTLVYIGGQDTIIGDTTTSYGNLFDVSEVGSVFGAGLGRTNSRSAGAVLTSYVVINGGIINGSVYGGGNYGASGANNFKSDSSSVIEIYDGNIKKSVYGGANSTGSGLYICGTSSECLAYNYYQRKTVARYKYYPDNSYSAYGVDISGGYCNTSGGCRYYEFNPLGSAYSSSTTYYKLSASSGASSVTPSTYSNNTYFHSVDVNIHSDDAIIDGSVYGGSNVTGTVSGSTNLDLYGGTISGSAYGGGKGQSTVVTKAVSVNTQENTALKILNIYGGSEFGSVNTVSGDTTVNINGGIVENVFGGGQGDDTTAPYTYGKVTVNVKSGDIGNVYGGTETNGVLPASGKTIGVYVTGGEIDNVFGGSYGELASVSDSYVSVSGGTIGNVYGGGNKARVTGSTDVDISEGDIQNAFGGGNEATVSTSNITITGGSIAKALYGGGNKAKVDNTTVNVSGGTFTQATEDQDMGLGVFGGGANVSDAGAVNTTVNINAGANVYNVYGGSNVSGTITGTAQVNATAGSVMCNLYGGGYQAAITNSDVNLTGTKFSYTIPTNEDGVALETVYTASCGMVFGGGAAADVIDTADVSMSNTKLIALYGGSNKSGTVVNSIVTINDGVANAIFGGNNIAGSVIDSNVALSQTSNKVLLVDNVYGGSNGKNAFIGNYDTVSGRYTVGTAEVTFTDGIINENIFGGGNEAPVYGSTTVTMTGGEVNRVYGGGNKAFIGDNSTFDTKFADNATTTAATGTATSTVNIASGIVKDNVYGSGNASFVDGNTFVNIANASATEAANKTLEIGGSVFGGSETNADEEKVFNYKSIGVSGNSTIVIDGEGYLDSNNKPTVLIKGSIYGGGNNSATRETAKLLMNKIGSKRSPMSMGSIQRLQNVYIKDSSIELNGARDRTSEKRYTYGFVRVDDLFLLGSETTSETLNGSSLYMVSGNTYLNNYHSGTVPDDFKVGYEIVDYYSPQEVIEGTDGNITPINSDNELFMYENVIFSVSASDEIKYDSNAGQVEGMTYLGMYNHGRSGNKLTLGYYDNDKYSEGGIVSTTDYNSITQSAYTFVYGRNDFDMDFQIKNHGFYTNNVVVNENQKTINVEYVSVKPQGNVYYQWLLGVVPKIIPVDLEATRYSIQGAKNVMITLDDLKEATGKDWKDATMVINRVDTSLFKPKSDDLRNGIEYDTQLVDKSKIPSVNTNDENNDGVVDANNLFALSMGTITSGWLNNYKTNIYDNDTILDGTDFCQGDSAGDCTGDSQYVYDSTDIQRGLTFWLYHSKNLDFSVSNANDRENAIISLGKITIETTFRNPHADPTAANQEVTVFIEINVTMSDSTRDGYGKAIAPGTKYTVFDSISTSIPTTGAFSIYQSLSLDLTRPMISDETKTWDVNDLYGVAETKDGIEYSESYRYLASNYLFPKGTKITMLDLVMNEQYYYEVNRDNRDAVSSAAGGSTEYRYMLEDFIRMGSTSTDNKYNDDMNGDKSEKYYTHDGDVKVAVEEFIFNVDFSGVDPEDITVVEAQTYYLFMQLSRDENGVEKVKLSPTGVPTTEMVYTLNPNLSSVLNTTGGFVQEGTDELSESTTIYVGEDTDLRLETEFKQNISGTTDTSYDDYKLGAKITIKRPSKDPDGNVIEGAYDSITADLFGTVFTINGKKYYPQIDGVTRIELAGRVSYVDSDINIDFSNSSLTYGDYVIFVETFASYDGLYYGDADLVEVEFPITLLNNQYGLNVNIPPVQITHDVNTGLDKNGDKKITYTINTKNGVSDPHLRISLQRRNYTDVTLFDHAYTNIDLKNIATLINVGKVDQTVDATNILDTCYLEKNGSCDVYTLAKLDSSKETEDFIVEMTLKEGPTANDLADLSTSGWKSGTYRVVFTLYDGDVPVGSVYEYLIIRSLDVDEIIEGSAN